MSRAAVQQVSKDNTAAARAQGKLANPTQGLMEYNKTSNASAWRACVPTEDAPM
jgi:hypothetical protein